MPDCVLHAFPIASAFGPQAPVNPRTNSVSRWIAPGRIVSLMDGDALWPNLTPRVQCPHQAKNGRDGGGLPGTLKTREHRLFHPCAPCHVALGQSALHAQLCECVSEVTFSPCLLYQTDVVWVTLEAFKHYAHATDFLRLPGTGATTAVACTSAGMSGARTAPAGCIAMSCSSTAACR